MKEAGIPGPGLTDPIVVVGDPGFSAEIPLESWLTVGATATVQRRVPRGQWLGQVQSFHRSRFVVARWRLASGEERRQGFFADASAGYTTGRTFTVSDGRHEWQAEVVEDEPATRVVIEYTLQRGTSSRAFFRRGELKGYGTPTADGMIRLCVLGPESPEAPPTG